MDGRGDGGRGSLDFLALGRSFGLSSWEAQSLWQRLTDDPQYRRSPEPARWLHAAFVREAAAMGQAERSLEESRSPALDRESPNAPAVGKRTLVEVELQGRGTPYAGAVGKRTLVDGLQRRGLPYRAGVGSAIPTTVEKAGRFARGTGGPVPGHEMIPTTPAHEQPVQLRAQVGRDAVSDMDAATVQEVAAQGVAGNGGAMPHGDAIARSFGPEFDISGLQAHVGGTAAGASEALGAHAYASGSHVAFARAPDLHTAAHESAHAVLQLRGVAPATGVGAKDDAFERHADDVADAVVAGRPAGPLLAKMSGGAQAAGTSSRSAAVQLKPNADATQTFSNGIRRLNRSKLTLLGASNPELWNWVKASETDATAAEVAALLVDDAAWAAATKGSGMGSTWAWAFTPKASGQFEINSAVALQLPMLVQYRASGTDQASKNNEAMARSVKTGGAVSGGIELGKEDRDSRQRAKAILADRLDDMIDEPHWMLAVLPRDYEVAENVGSGPGYSTTFDGDAFYQAVRAKLVGYLRKASEGGLRKLLEPADIETEVAAVLPARSRDAFGQRETGELAAFVGEKLRVATLESLDRLVPRVVAATFAHPERALRRSDVPYHGYLDSIVLSVFLEVPSPLTVVRTVAQVAADKKAAAAIKKVEQHRLEKLDYAGLSRTLDLTLNWVNMAREVSAPWSVPIATDLSDWVASHQDHILGMPEDKVRGLVPIIDAQFAVVRDAYFGIEAVAKTSAKPSSAEEAAQTPEYDVMYEYAMAITHSRTAGDAQRHLAKAQAQHRKLSVTSAEQALRGSRISIGQASVGKDEGVAHPRQVAADEQQKAEAAVWKAGQSAVAGTDTDADTAQLTEVIVAADERGALHRLRGIVRTLQQLGEVADSVDATAALKLLLSLTEPVNQVRVTLETALAKAADDYKRAGGSDAARATWLKQRREAVFKANQALGELVKAHALERVVQRAQEEIEDAQIRKMITELIVMFALGLVTGGVASMVGGLVRGMVLARTASGMFMVGEAMEVVGGGGYVMAQIAGGFATLGTDVTLMSLGQTALTGQPLRESLKQNLLGSSVMAVAMKPFGALAHDLKQVGAGLASRGTVLTLEVIGTSAANFAAMKLQAEGSATEPQLRDWLMQGGMMVVGKAVGARLAATHQRLAMLGETAGLRKLAALQELVNQTSQGKNIESLPDLVAGERQVLAIETEAIARARASGTLSDEKAAALEADNRAATAEVAPERIAQTLWAARGLEQMSGDGTHWYGSREQIAGAIADAGPTARVVRETADSIYAHIDGKDVRFSIGIARGHQDGGHYANKAEPARAREAKAQPGKPPHDELIATGRGEATADSAVDTATVKDSPELARAKAEEQARLAKIRTGTGHTRDATELPTKAVVESMNAQLENVKVAEIDAIVGKYPADQQVRVRTVLARSSGFGKMEGLNSLRTALEPHLQAGKKLYAPGQGSLADNMYYLDAEKHSFDTTHANLTKPEMTSKEEPNTVVILDQVVLAKMNDPMTGKDFAKRLVANKAVLLEPRGFVDGNNMYNSGSRDVIAGRTDAVLKRASDIEAAQKIPFDEAVGKALDEASTKAIEAQDPAVAAALKAQLQVVDPAAHADIGSAAIANQVNSSGEVTEAQLETSLAKVPEADRPYLRELLAQQAEIFSPRRQGNELAAQGQKVLDLASAQGIPKDKVFYFIPKTNKSYGMVAMAHREATSTPVDHYIEGPAGLQDAIASGKIDDSSMLVILDDVAGSGDSLVGATVIAQANGYRGKLAISPTVSTGTANEVFNSPFGISSSNPNVAYVPGRIAPALRETAYYKKLTDAGRDRVEDLLVYLGWGQNGLSMAFPYMAPDNNNQFFGSEIAREYVINRNDNVKAVKTSGPWAPRTTGSNI